MRLTELMVAALRRQPSGSALAIPEAGHDLWRIFCELSASRTYHTAGPNPISYAEIDAYCRLFRWPLQPHHVDIIRALDAAYIEHAYDRNTKPGQDMGGGHSVTPALFDAMFGIAL